MATASVAYHLRAAGADEIKSSFREIAQSGDQSAKRLASSFDRDLKTAEGAVERLERKAKQLEAIGSSNVQRFVNGNTGVDSGGMRSAEQSAAALVRQQDQLLRQKEMLLSQFDPMIAAQSRYNSVIDQASNLRRREIITEEQFIQVEGRARQALQEVGNASLDVGRQSGAMRAGIQNAGFQVSDFAVQVGAGTSATRAFALQGPQLIQALSMMGMGADQSSGKFAKFAGFISGPWGAALTVGVSIMGAFMTKMESADDASDDLSKSLDFQRTSHKELTKAIEEQNKALDQQIEISSVATRAALKQAEADLTAAINKREKTKATLEEAKADYALQQTTATDKFGRMALTIPGARVNDIQRDIGSQDKEIEGLQARLRKTQILNNRLDVDAATDPAAASRQRFEARQAGLDRDLRAGRISEDQNRAGLLEATRARDAETKAIQEQNKERERMLRGPGAEPKRTDKQIYDDFVAELGKRGVQQASGRTGFRTAADQHDIYKQGLTPLDGYQKVSRHQTWQAFDPTRASASDQSAWGAARAAGLEGFKIVNESGGRKHYQWNGAGDRGEVDFRAQEEADKAHADWVKGNIDAYQAFMDRIDPAAAELRKTMESLAQIDALVKAGPANGGITAEQGASMRLDVQSRGFMPNLAGDLSGRRDSEGDLAKVEADQRETVGRIGADQAEQLVYLDRELELVTASTEERRRQMQALDFMLGLKRQGIEAATLEGEALIRGNEIIADRAQLLREQTEQWQEMQQFGERMIDTVLDTSRWDNFGDIATSVLGDIKQEMLKLALINPLKNAMFGGGAPTLFGGGGGGIGGLLGGVVSLFGGKAPGSAVGTEHWGGGYTWLAENGPELVSLPQGSKVTPAAKTRRMMESNSKPTSNNVTYNIDATGADAAGLARLEAKIGEIERNRYSDTLAVFSDAKSRFLL